MKEKQRYHIGIGVPSILMIFVVLCLTTFGVLSYSSASADYRLTEKNISYVEAYYSADMQVQELLASVDAVLAEARAESVDEAEYRARVMSEMQVIAVQAHVNAYQQGDELYIAWQVPVTEEKSLSVVILVQPFEQEERYQIEEYCLKQPEGAAATGGIIIDEEEGNVGLWQGGN